MCFPQSPGLVTGEYIEGLYRSTSYFSVMGKTVLGEKWKHRCLQNRQKRTKTKMQHLTTHQRMYLLPWHGDVSWDVASQEISRLTEIKSKTNTFKLFFAFYFCVNQITALCSTTCITAAQLQLPQCSASPRRCSIAPQGLATRLPRSRARVAHEWLWMQSHEGEV